MSRHFSLRSEHNGAIAKRLPNSKNQLSMTDSLFDQFITRIIDKSGFACKRCVAGRQFVSAGGALRPPGVTLINYKIDRYIDRYMYICITLFIVKFTMITY